VKRLIRFLQREAWEIPSEDLSGIRAVRVKFLRIVILSVRGFHRDDCLFRASALTFYSLLSIVPLFAMAFGLAKGFGFESTLQRQILERFQGQEAIILKATDFAHSLLENTQGGLIAGAGVLLLFWTIIRVLGNIEDSFNHIWGIKKSRPFPRKISDYLSAMLVCPVLLIVSSAVTVVIRSQITTVVRKIGLLGTISGPIFFALRFLPYAVIWVLFTFVYLFMPNGKIKFRSGIFAGIIGGTLYQLFQAAYVTFQIGVAKYNAIYGSFAALPLFLIWLQVSWMIVLLGAEICSAHQNAEHGLDIDVSSLSYSQKRLLSLQVTHMLVKHFSCSEGPVRVEQVADTLGLSVRVVKNILQELVRCGLVSEICSRHGPQPAYQPAGDINRYSIKYVLDRLDQPGPESLPAVSSGTPKKLSQCLKALGDTMQKSPANLLLKDI